MNFLNRTLAFDFGSANTVVCEKDHIVFDEETMISVWPEGCIDVSREASIGCREGNRTYFPVSGGYVADSDHFEAYVKGVVKKLARFPRFRSVVIAMPDELSDDKSGNRAFLDAFVKLKVKNVKTVPQSVAAVAGLGLQSGKYHLILDIGYGKARVSLVKDSCVLKTRLLKNVSGESWISEIRT